MSEVPKMTNAFELAQALNSIGSLKEGLPVHLKGWINEAGLYVRWREFLKETWVQAGGRFRRYFVARNRAPLDLVSPDWEIRLFRQETWHDRFAHLVWPTFEIALFVSGDAFTPTGSGFDEGAAASLKQVVMHFKATGEWLGLLHNKCANCAREVTIWQWQHETCPYCGGNLRKTNT
jgi:hypothetical protein